jgi:hypothetical protein
VPRCEASPPRLVAISLETMGSPHCSVYIIWILTLKTLGLEVMSNVRYLWLLISGTRREGSLKKRF